MSTPESSLNTDRDTLMHGIGFCLLKPSYSNIAEPFVADLSEHGLDVAHQRDITLPECVIDYMYRDSRGEFFYPQMVDMLGRSSVRAMIVKKQTEEVQDSAQDILEHLKRGTQGYPNLRQKYQRPEHVVTDYVFDKWRRERPAEHPLNFTITQGNVFHASDSPLDAWATMLRIRDSSEGVCFFQSPPDGGMASLVHLLDRSLTSRYFESTMDDITKQWKVIDSPPIDSNEAPIRQVYLWILTSDNQLVIVSKDGETWQLPGGKPDYQEGATDAVVREVGEETGIDISPNRDDLTFFGEYTITDPSPDTLPVYRQVRAWIKLDTSSDSLRLSTSGETNDQDSVKFVKSVPVTEIPEYIPWMSESEEYRALVRKGIIENR